MNLQRGAAKLNCLDDGAWTAHPDAFLRQYEGVTGIDDYLDCLVQQIAPESAPGDGLAVQDSHRHVSKREFHFFISHASKDKDAIARPLYQGIADPRVQRSGSMRLSSRLVRAWLSQ